MALSERVQKKMISTVRTVYNGTPLSLSIGSLSKAIVSGLRTIPLYFILITHVYSPLHSTRYHGVSFVNKSPVCSHGLLVNIIHLNITLCEHGSV